MTGAAATAPSPGAVGGSISGDGGFEIRRLHPFQAVKTYLCPGCYQDILPGTGHLVVVPLDAVDERRHWHHPCWEHRHRRRPGRSRFR